MSNNVVRRGNRRARAPVGERNNRTEAPLFTLRFANDVCSGVT
jgi:hypothetical protein